jgi:biotin transport system substrate-specific component
MQAAIRNPTLVDVALPRLSSRAASIARDAVLVAAGAGLVAACAQVVIPMQPVPLTGQTFAVLLVGGLLGFLRGFAALALYWVVGALGAPIFAEGNGGWSVVESPSGGYIIGFILAAAVVGFLCQHGGDRTVLRMLGVLFLGNLLIYAVGVPWLAEANIGEGGTDFGWAAAWDAGMAPFIGGDLIKLFAAVGLLPAGWAIARKLRAKGADTGHKPGIA